MENGPSTCESPTNRRTTKCDPGVNTALPLLMAFSILLAEAIRVYFDSACMLPFYIHGFDVSFDDQERKNNVGFDDLNKRSF